MKTDCQDGPRVTPQDVVEFDDTTTSCGQIDEVTVVLSRTERDLICRCLACVRRIAPLISMPEFDADAINRLQAKVE